MIFADTYKPEFQSMRALLLEVAQERSVEALRNLIVHRLARRPHIALARMWLIRPGDLCETCPRFNPCPDQKNCLHLVASAGSPVAHNADAWSRIDGDHQRRPLGLHEIGHIAVSGEPVRIVDTNKDPDWIIRNNWAENEGIRGFVGEPLLYKGEVLGVIAVFLRIALNRVKGNRGWLRMLANHAAIAIANARAFEEIERLRSRLELENFYLRQELDDVRAFGDIVGGSPALRNILKQIELVAPTNASVFILGESGTGKELVAKEIHKLGRRRDRPLIRVNCASIPDGLYESEFFGHVKGAFTGAMKNRAGRFEIADGGTLLLDEVGEIPLPLQAKLLRVLQEGEFERVGDEKTRKVDVRIIATTNRDIRREVEGGRFRKDLYYRINLFPIEIPPLRQRKEDIPPLTEHFLGLVARKMNCQVPTLTQSNLFELQDYDWPGNVRELQNVIERAMITSRPGTLRFDLPSSQTSEGVPFPSAILSKQKITVLTEGEMKQRERENIRAALDICGWKISGSGGASALLGVKPTTLKARMKKMGIERQS